MQLGSVYDTFLEKYCGYCNGLALDLFLQENQYILKNREKNVCWMKKREIFIL